MRESTSAPHRSLLGRLFPWRGRGEPGARGPELVPPPELQALNMERILLHAAALAVMSTWSLSSVGLGALGSARAKSASRRSFSLTHALAQVPVLASAAVGALVIARQDPTRTSLPESLRKGLRLERALLVGVTLDALVAGVGVWLRERGLRRSSPALRGAGQALAVQGMLLLPICTTLVLINSSFERRLLGMVGPGRSPAGEPLRLPV